VVQGQRVRHEEKAKDLDKDLKSDDKNKDL